MKSAVEPAEPAAATRMALGASLTLVSASGPSLALRRHNPTMYRVTVMLLMTLAVVAAGVVAYWVASVALEWL
jgi:hypothetical protein